MKGLSLEWRWKKFESLTVPELYDLIQLRERVFIVEQSCAYLDCDGLDSKAWHLSGYNGTELVAYLRVFPEKVKYEEVSFGRVVTAPEYRKKGYGRELVLQALERIQETLGPLAIRISAQSYLEEFYEDFGFIREGQGYLEDGIPHIEMLRSGKL